MDEFYRLYGDYAHTGSVSFATDEAILLQVEANHSYAVGGVAYLDACDLDGTAGVVNASNFSTDLAALLADNNKSSARL